MQRGQEGFHYEGFSSMGVAGQLLVWGRLAILSHFVGRSPLHPLAGLCICTASVAEVTGTAQR